MNNEGEFTKADGKKLFRHCLKIKFFDKLNPAEIDEIREAVDGFSEAMKDYLIDTKPDIF